MVALETSRVSKLESARGTSGDPLIMRRSWVEGVIRMTGWDLDSLLPPVITMLISK